MSERADGFSLDEIVERFGGELVGDGSRRITQVAPLERATADQISFLANPKFRQQLQGTKAGAVVLTPAAANACPGFHIICANPYAYYARASIPRRLLPRSSPGMHTLARMPSLTLRRLSDLAP